MDNHYPISNLCDFEIMISTPLSNYDQKILLKLYMPIIGNKAISLYQTLYSFVAESVYESDIYQHEKIVKLMHLRSIEKFCDLRNMLEAVGLLDTYYKDNLYVYYLKKPFDALTFFNTVELSTLLEYQVGHDAYLATYLEFVVRKLDLNKFEKVSHSFDEVFNIESSEDILLSDASKFGKNNGILVSTNHLDYHQFTILLSAQNLIKEDYFIRQDFIDLIYRYSFLYGLDAQEMKDVVVLSCDENREVEYSEVAKNAKLIYNQKGKKLGVIPKTAVKKTTKTNNKLINFLEMASPNEFVKQKTGTVLTGSEIEMFDQLLRDTNINIGVLNVLIGYVLEELKGQIPGYNYFLKIINTWKRAKVNSTLDAIDYINHVNRPKKHTQVKPEKSVPDWYEGYLDDVKKKNQSTKAASILSPELEELNDFFNPDRKDK